MYVFYMYVFYMYVTYVTYMYVGNVTYMYSTCTCNVHVDALYCISCSSSLVFQMGYTSLFGIYSNFIFLRTGASLATSR